MQAPAFSHEVQRADWWRGGEGVLQMSVRVPRKVAMEEHDSHPQQHAHQHRDQLTPQPCSDRLQHASCLRQGQLRRFVKSGCSKDRCP